MTKTVAKTLKALEIEYAFRMAFQKGATPDLVGDARKIERAEIGWKTTRWRPDGRSSISDDAVGLKGS